MIKTMPILNTNTMAPMMISGSGKRAMTISQDIPKTGRCFYPQGAAHPPPLLLSAATAGRSPLNE